MRTYYIEFINLWVDMTSWSISHYDSPDKLCFGEYDPKDLGYNTSYPPQIVLITDNIHEMRFNLIFLSS